MYIILNSNSNYKNQCLKKQLCFEILFPMHPRINLRQKSSKARQETRTLRLGPRYIINTYKEINVCKTICKIEKKT